MRFLASCFTVVAVVLPLLVTAAPSATIDAVKSGADGITITGTWPDACAPHIQAQTSNTTSVDVLLSSTQNVCAKRPQAFTVTVDQRDMFSPASGSDRVRPLHVFAAANGSAQAALVGFRLLGGSIGTIHPDTGFWWPIDDRVAVGSVLSLEVQDGALGVALMTYAQHGGDPVWYFGTTQLVGSIAHVELTRLQGGASPFGPAQVQPQPQPALAMDMHFLSDTRAHIWISRSAPGSGGIELVSLHVSRVPFSNLPQAQNWLGEWLLATSPSAPMETALPDMLVWIDSIQLDKRHVRLLDDSGTFALDCRHTGIGEYSPAQQCILRNIQGNVLVRFDQVGLQRLDGTRADGSPVVMVRPH